MEVLVSTASSVTFHPIQWVSSPLSRLTFKYTYTVSLVTGLVHIVMFHGPGNAF